MASWSTLAVERALSHVDFNAQQEARFLPNRLEVRKWLEQNSRPALIRGRLRADFISGYAKIALLERTIGRQTLQIDFKRGSEKRSKAEIVSVVVQNAATSRAFHIRLLLPLC
jgi:hypothetical protein